MFVYAVYPIQKLMPQQIHTDAPRHEYYTKHCTKYLQRKAVMQDTLLNFRAVMVKLLA